MNSLALFGLLLKASLFSTSGTGNLPILHGDLLARGWAEERHFAEALAIGQVAPGPTGLWVISLAYLVNGLPGALLAAVAITLPPLLVLLVARLYRRVGHHPVVEGFVRGLGLAVVGAFFVVLLDLMRGAGIAWSSLALAGGSLGLALTRRVPVLVILTLAAVAGYFLY